VHPYVYPHMMRSIKNTLASRQSTAQA